MPPGAGVSCGGVDGRFGAIGCGVRWEIGRAVSREMQHPARTEDVRIGQLDTVGEGPAPVQLVDVSPATRIAELPLGDVSQRVPGTNAVGGAMVHGRNLELPPGTDDVWILEAPAVRLAPSLVRTEDPSVPAARPKEGIGDAPERVALSDDVFALPPVYRARDLLHVSRRLRSQWRCARDCGIRTHSPSEKRHRERGSAEASEHHGSK